MTHFRGFCECSTPQAGEQQVEHGWITLSGRVDWAYQSHMAVRAISQMRSVTGVTDHIAVHKGSALRKLTD